MIATLIKLVRRPATEVTPVPPPMSYEQLQQAIREKEAEIKLAKERERKVLIADFAFALRRAGLTPADLMKHFKVTVTPKRARRPNSTGWIARGAAPRKLHDGTFPANCYVNNNGELRWFYAGGIVGLRDLVRGDLRLFLAHVPNHSPENLQAMWDKLTGTKNSVVFAELSAA